MIEKQVLRALTTSPGNPGYGEASQRESRFGSVNEEDEHQENHEALISPDRPGKKVTGI
jgi:hypothetical protein